MTILRVLTAGGLAALSACTTLVSGGKAGPDVEGIEYSLPVPIVRVTPQPNGTMLVAVDYLPDPDNTYVLRTSSVFSKYTLDVQRENGMLKSVSLDATADALAAAAVGSAGNVLKARAEATLKEQEAAATAAKDQAKAVDEAQLAVVTAEAKVLALKNQNSDGKLDDQITAAEVAAAEARAKRDHLVAAASGANASSLNVARKRGATPQAAAPVLFRVVPDIETGGVKLVTFEGPRFLPTGTAAKPVPKPEDLTLTLLNSARTAKGQPQFKLSVNKAVKSVDLAKSDLADIAHGGKNRRDLVEDVKVLAAGTGSELIVTLQTGTPNGTYAFTPRLLQESGQPMQADPVSLVVVAK